MQHAALKGWAGAWGWGHLQLTQGRLHLAAERARAHVAQLAARARARLGEVEARLGGSARHAHTASVGPRSAWGWWGLSGSPATG